MPEGGIKKYSQFLLPGKTLRVFGVDGEYINKLEYEIDSDRFKIRYNKKVNYNLYINRQAPQKRSIEFSDLQFF